VESLGQLTLGDLKGLVKSWVMEAMLEIKQAKQETGEKEKNFLTVEEASSLLGLVPVTIYSKVAKGEIQAYKRGKRLYFSREALLNYIREEQKPVLTKKEKE